MDFSFLQDMFIDPDGINDTLTISVKWRVETGSGSVATYRMDELPDWFLFLSKNRRFNAQMKNIKLRKDFSKSTIVPKDGLAQNHLNQSLRTDQLQYPIQLVVTASDTVETVSVDFLIIVYDNQPFNYRPVSMKNQVSAPVYVHVDTYFTIPVFRESIADLDFFDTLTYQIFVNDTSLSKVDWMIFSEEKMLLKGFASIEGFSEICTNLAPYPFQLDGSALTAEQYYCVYSVMVRASDGVLSCNQSFDLIIYNNRPVYAHPLPVTNHHISQFLKFTLSMHQFCDADQDTLQYVVGMEDELQPWPLWLRFNPMYRIFNGQPDADLLEKCRATDLLRTQSAAQVESWNHTMLPVPLVQCTFLIRITVKDLRHSVTGVWPLIVYNHIPI